MHCMWNEICHLEAALNGGHDGGLPLKVACPIHHASNVGMLQMAGDAGEGGRRAGADCGDASLITTTAISEAISPYSRAVTPRRIVLETKHQVSEASSSSLFAFRY